MLVIIAASWALYLRGRPASPWIARHYDELNTALFLYAPLMPILWGYGARRGEPTSLADYGLSLRGAKRGLVIFGATFAVVAPLYIVAMYWASLHGPWWFHPKFDPHIPRNLGGVAFFQLVQVALPEEFFFRGYAQGRMDLALRGRVNVLGARVGFGMIFANALFALAHPLQMNPFMVQSWGRLETFIPGLLFGWLRARSGSLVAPLCMHAAANLMLFSVVQGG